MYYYIWKWLLTIFSLFSHYYIFKISIENIYWVFKNVWNFRLLTFLQGKHENPVKLIPSRIISVLIYLIGQFMDFKFCFQGIAKKINIKNELFRSKSKMYDDPIISNLWYYNIERTQDYKIIELNYFQMNYH